jgi:4a-hydroxytetrahydrobiopterin dehydratase
MSPGSSRLRPLTGDEIAIALRDLPGWSHENHALVRSACFLSFDDAICFMMLAASEADALDHHPDWSNHSNRVDIRLTTHDSRDQVTRVDLELARRMQAYLPPC